MGGYAFGAGITGIRHKVRKGCEQLAQKINNKINSNDHKTLQKVIFNVYGFSRGAAAVRNFVYEISKASYKARERTIDDITFYYDHDDMPAIENLPAGGHLGYSLLRLGIRLNTSIIEVNFLGIFDTVSSYSTSLNPKFSNDIAELNLNSLSKAKNVIHFTATDEMRENFSLTRSPKGIEKNLPGVHSDIGGSYLSGKEIIKEIETSWTTKSKLEKLQSNLIQEGWYKTGELTITGGNLYWALRGEKAMVYKEYSFIPLHFMCDYSNDNKAEINTNLLVSKYSITSHPLLKKVKETLKPYVRGNEKNPYELKNITSSDLKDLKDLRYGYFHRSARKTGIGMSPNSDWKRKELKP